MPYSDELTIPFTWGRQAYHDEVGYEVSTAGDKRFSALCARLRDGRTIEEAYQLDVKGYRKQSNAWEFGKGKPPLTPMTPDELYRAYLALWVQWAKENPSATLDLYYHALGKKLTDKFGWGETSQARALCYILNRMLVQNQIDYFDNDIDPIPF